MTKTIAVDRLEELAARCEASASKVRGIECSPEYEVYWRGYASALDYAAEQIRTLQENGK